MSDEGKDRVLHVIPAISGGPSFSAVAAFFFFRDGANIPLICFHHTKYLLWIICSFICHIYTLFHKPDKPITMAPSEDTLTKVSTEGKPDL
jgi:hypothetical protein